MWRWECVEDVFDTSSVVVVLEDDKLGRCGHGSHYIGVVVKWWWREKSDNIVGCVSRD